MDNLSILKKLSDIRAKFEKLRIKNQENEAINNTVNSTINNQQNEPINNRVKFENHQNEPSSIFNQNLEILSLLNRKPDEIAIEFVLNHSINFDSFLINVNNLNETHLFKNLIKLVEKLFESHAIRKEANSRPLHMFLNSSLLNRHIFDYLTQSNNHNVDLIKSLVSIYCSITSLNIHHLDNRRLEQIRDELEFIVKRRLNKNRDLNEYFNYKMNQLNPESHERPPPNDFTELSIVPCLEDIVNDDHQQPFIRKNIINGPYESVHDYLDTQFRLLREDFFQPLRLGVTEFRSIVEESKQVLTNEICFKLERIDSLYVYFDVTLKSSMPCNEGIVYSMLLNFNKNSRRIRWENSKRLIHGSLVCLSSDYFQNECLIAIVCDRSIDKHEKSVLIKFDESVSNLPVSNKNYVMLETTAFFESYKHVLHALVSFQLENEQNFPFKEQIVYGNNTQIIEIPNYLKQAQIDFSPLIKNNPSNRLYNKCFISNEYNWPTASSMQLEDSQYDAIKLALKNKLAIVQGPPGTGKTYIGVKLVQLLIHNRELWYNRPHESRKPILMICYTNHALDQFLENCVNECKLTKGVVRVGGRCKSESLEPFLLRNQKRKHNNKNIRKLRTLLRCERESLNDIKRQIFKYQDQLKFCNDSGLLLNLKCLEKFISAKHMQQFEAYMYTPSKKYSRMKTLDMTLLEWLDFSKFADYEEDFLIKPAETNTEFIHFLNSFNLTRSDFGLAELDPAEEKLYIDLMKDENLLFYSNLNHESNNLASNNNNDDYDDDDEYDDLAFTNQLNSDRMLEDEINQYAQVIEQTNKKFLFYKNYYDFALSKDEIFNLSVRNELPENENLLDLVSSQKYQSILAYLKNIFNTNQSDHSLEFEDIWSISIKDRIQLYMSWTQHYRESLEQKLYSLQKVFNQKAQSTKNLRLQEDKIVMQNSFIIAMTTCGSARYHDVLKEISPRIVIVEEAAEVFEQHIVSSLSPKCEHLILIGDHIQLRPTPSVYNLAIDYHLDVSLFERLLNNNSKKVMLNIQHRMRPEISVLMKNFYDNPVQDHASVMLYPDVNGFKKNIFFIDHNNLERVANDSQSKSNLFEVDFIINLCLYLLKQNYQQTQITILTMYLGQMSELNRLLRFNQLTNVKCTTVDNYQGEENDIVLLSLVRSNEHNVIGFLKIYNRCCVALSRAKIGFYVIGDFGILSRNSEKWSNIYSMLYNTHSVGRSITLSCGNHPENDIEAATPQDIAERSAYSGGCHLKCQFPLRCGHFCQLFCHTYDLAHFDYKCTVIIEKKIAECGHTVLIECSAEARHENCTQIIQKQIDECGHFIQFKCNQTPKHIDCMEIKQVNLTCRHQSELSLACNSQVYTYQNKCLKKCNQLLDCMHKCSSTCSACYGGYIHSDCIENCKLNLFCGHKCKSLCSVPCGPCDQKCRTRCFHSKCKFKCADPCNPCLKPCKWSCAHKKCTKKCYEKCDREVCNEPCDLKLNCGHPCIGLCGETCPRLCRICDKAKLLTITNNNSLSVEKLYFIHLIDCNHLVEFNQMDRLMNEYSQGQCLTLPECPVCSAAIRLNMRYSNAIKLHTQKLNFYKQKQYCHKSGISIDGFVSSLTNADTYLKRQFGSDLKNELKTKSASLTRNELISYMNRWHLYLYLTQMRTEFEDYFWENKRMRECIEQKNFIYFELNKLERILKTNLSCSLFEGKQKYKEILNELERFEYLFKYIQYKNLKDNNKNLAIVKTLLDDIEANLITNIIPFNKLTHIKETFFRLESLTYFEPKFKSVKPLKALKSFDILFLNH